MVDWNRDETWTLVASSGTLKGSSGLVSSYRHQHEIGKRVFTLYPTMPATARSGSGRHANFPHNQWCASNICSESWSPKKHGFDSHQPYISTTPQCCHDRRTLEEDFMATGPMRSPTFLFSSPCRPPTSPTRPADSQPFQRSARGLHGMSAFILHSSQSTSNTNFNNAIGDPLCISLWSSSTTDYLLTHQIEADREADDAPNRVSSNIAGRSLD